MDKPEFTSREQYVLELAARKEILDPYAFSDLQKAMSSLISKGHITRDSSSGRLTLVTEEIRKKMRAELEAIRLKNTYHTRLKAVLRHHTRVTARRRSDRLYGAEALF